MLKSVNWYTRQLADIQGKRKVCFILLLYLSLYDFYSVKIQPRACSLPLSWTVVEYHSQSHWAKSVCSICGQIAVSNSCSLTLKALQYFCINHGDERVFWIWNHHVLSYGPAKRRGALRDAEKNSRCGPTGRRGKLCRAARRIKKDKLYRLSKQWLHWKPRRPALRRATPRNERWGKFIFHGRRFLTCGAASGGAAP